MTPRPSRFTVLSPPLGTVLRPLARATLRLLGWRVEGTVPEHERYVLVAAPHTSNWDAFYLLLMACVLRVRLHWMGKSELFRAPLGGMMRWLGGIPVDRSAPGQMVSRMAKVVRAADQMVLCVPPEGTRSRARRWKTGFYYIATEARIPLALGYLDYASKTGGIGPSFMPSGDLDADLLLMKSFYGDKRGKHQHDFGEVTVAGEPEPRKVTTGC